MGNYDEVFNKRKIENWRPTERRVFLNKNLRDLVPSLRKYGDYSLTYLDMVDKVEQSLSDLAQLNTYAQGVEDRERLKIAVMKYLPANFNIKYLHLYDFFFYANEAIRITPKPKK